MPQRRLKPLDARPEDLVIPEPSQYADAGEMVVPQCSLYRSSYKHASLAPQMLSVT